MDEKTKVITCGCRFNRYESEEIRRRIDAEPEKPLVIVNTCAVTAKSEAKSRHAIRRAVRENPGASVIVSGCLAEISPGAMKAIEGVSLVVGNEEKFHLGKHLTDPEASHTGGVNSATSFVETPVGMMKGRTAAYLKIQNGCDELCTFCVVRLARGKSRSASARFVLEQAQKLQQEGAKEIVLTGINLGQYGQDRDEGVDLPELLNRLAALEGVRFRLSSINPTEVTDRLLAVMARHHNICNYLHVPLQSGSDRILKEMKRPYNSAFYRDRILAAAAALPGLGLGCDIMTGFPGESEQDFNESLRMVEELPFTYAHVFTYSDRPGTPAHEMAGKVPASVRKERTARLKEAAAEKGRAFRQRLVGHTVETLIENRRNKNGLLVGKTDTFLPVTLEGGDELMGTVVDVPVTCITDGGLMGGLPVAAATREG